MNTESFPIDINQHEQMQHGSDAFPCTWYVDRYFNSGYPAHWHDELEIGTVQRGSMKLEINGQNYILHRGDSIFVNSCTLHAYEGERETETLFLNILFQASLVYGAENSVFREKYVRPVLEHSHSSFLIIRGDTEEGKMMSEQIEEIYELMQKAEWGWEFAVRNRLSEIFLSVSKNLQQVYEHIYKYVYEVEERYEPKNLQRTRRMVDYIQNHYTEVIVLEQIADAASISTRECMRCFQNVLGISPKQYLIRLRIQKACRLLTESGMRLLDICELCGFQDQSYFTKLFHREMGCSPGQYRKEQMKRNSHK